MENKKRDLCKLLLDGSMKTASIELIVCIVIGVLGYNVLPGILLGLVWITSVILSIPVSKIVEKIIHRELPYSIMLVITIVLWVVISAPLFIIWAQIP